MDYKSKSGVLPKNSITRATARTGIHNLRADIWQFDFAMYWTICMLYLVEFANWNSPDKIGYGCGNGSLLNSGLTDNMSYHTGTILSSRTSYGPGIQYRYIEDPWANGDEFLSGLFFVSNSSPYDRMWLCVYEINYLIDFQAHGTNIGKIDHYDSYSFITSTWTTPPGSEQYWLPAPKTGVNNTYTSQYVTDLCMGPSEWIGDYPQIYRTGGVPNQSPHRGFFFLASSRTDLAAWDISSRLMVVPSTRIS